MEREKESEMEREREREMKDKVSGCDFPSRQKVEKRGMKRERTKEKRRNTD